MNRIYDDIERIKNNLISLDVYKKAEDDKRLLMRKINKILTDLEKVL